MAEKQWNVQVKITESDRLTEAAATLVGNSSPLVGEGTARRNPADVNVAAIGDELATARALSDLSHQLLHAATEIVQAHNR
ncbi:MAG: DUF1876 domain-containing protein [Streptomyces sp.]|uniref:DUF1876 domain-containing protein n=1 Tax=Streptomyces sp. TaxID=1931 RepID=UPI003D6A5F59